MSIKKELRDQLLQEIAVLSAKLSDPKADISEKTILEITEKIKKLTEAVNEVEASKNISKQRRILMLQELGNQGIPVHGEYLPEDVKNSTISNLEKNEIWQKILNVVNSKVNNSNKKDSNIIDTTVVDSSVIQPNQKNIFKGYAALVLFGASIASGIITPIIGDTIISKSQSNISNEQNITNKNENIENTETTETIKYNTIGVSKLSTANETPVNDNVEPTQYLVDDDILTQGIYKPFVSSNDIELIRDGLVMEDIAKGETIYIYNDKSDSEKNTNKRAIYWDSKTETYLHGSVNPNSLTEVKDADVLAVTDGSKEMILDGSSDGSLHIMKYTPRYATAPLNYRTEPSTETGEIQGKASTGDVVYIYDSNKALNLEDDISWKQAIDDNNQVAYVASEYLREPSKVKYGYEDIEITDEDRAIFRKYKESWENDLMYAYKTGTSKNYNDTLALYITEDGNNYYCQTDVDLDNGTKNYGYGVMVNQNDQPNYGTVKYFKELGYDVTQPEYLELGKSTIPVEVVDKVSEYFISESIDNVKECLKEKDIKFEKKELLALTAITYQFGNGKSFISWFLDEYEKYGGNTEAFRDNLVTPGGNYPLKHVPGLTIIYKGQKYNRGNSNWDLFHNGICVMGSGPVEYYEIEDTSIDEISPTENVIDATESSTELLNKKDSTITRNKEIDEPEI